MLPLGVSIDSNRLRSAGFAVAITKPVNPSSLLDALMDCLADSFPGTPEPAAPLPASPPGPSPEQPEQPGSSGLPRVLLVEDNGVNRKLAQAILKKLGHSVDVAVDGQEAVDRLSERTYDLVLMDCQMPVLDGYEATRVIRDPASSVLDHSVKIVAMTANAMQGDREKCLAAGMDDYLAKPIRPAELAEKLAAWLAPELS
jgi:CheY-like chemotaxis protein